MSTVNPEQVYREVDHAVSTIIQRQSASGATGLAKSVIVGTSTPITTYYDLISSFPTLSASAIGNAVKAFEETTGFHPSQLSLGFGIDSAKEIGKKIINFNAFYIFFPIGLVLFIGIWLMMAFGWFDWATAMYLSLLLILIIYIFDVMYRIHAQHAIDSVNEKSSTSSAGNTVETFVAYLPQLIHAIATAIQS